jgi:hypothetical protein
MAAVFLSACATTPPIAALKCDVGATIKITYGITSSKTIFQVKEKVNVKKGKGLVFKLVPKGSTSKAGDLKNATVKIMGKPDDAKNSWFTLLQGSYNGTAGDGHRLGICANADPGTYEYEIEVVNFGKLDPRVIVEPS